MDNNELWGKVFSKTFSENDKSHSQVRVEKKRVGCDKIKFVDKFLKNDQVKHLLPNLLAHWNTGSVAKQVNDKVSGIKTCKFESGTKVPGIKTNVFPGSSVILLYS